MTFPQTLTDKAQTCTFLAFSELKAEFTKRQKTINWDNFYECVHTEWGNNFHSLTTITVISKAFNRCQFKLNMKSLKLLDDFPANVLIDLEN